MGSRSDVGWRHLFRMGVEFASMFRRFGSEVTMVQRSGQVLSHEDADIAEAVVEVLRDAMLPHPTLAEALNNLFMTLD